MTLDRHAAIEPLLTDYVLGELDAAQRREVEDHLPSCPACAGQVRELNQTFHSIALAEPPVAPPAHLKQRVMAALDAGSVDRVGSVEQARPDRLRKASGGQEGRAYRYWLAAAATVIVALGTLLVFSMQRTTWLEDALQQADAVHEELVRQLAQNDAQADLAVAILTAADMRRIDLSTGDASREALGRAYFSPAKGLLIVADRLPEPPAGRVYQVWLIGSRSSGPVSAGLLGDQRAGRGMLIVPAPPGVIGETVTIAITDEPPGGLASPTGAKHLVGS